MALLTKLLLWASGLLVLCAAVIVGLFMYFTSDLCANKMHSEHLSPDKKLKAVVFQRDCGATTRFTTEISIINSDDVLENQSGNVYKIYGQPKEAAPLLSWSGNDQLNIHRARTGTEFKAELQLGWFSPIQIKYIANAN